MMRIRTSALLFIFKANLSSLFFLLVLLLAPFVARAADKPKPTPKPAAPAAAPAAAADQDAMMKAWMDFATPGPAHKLLEEFAGSWDVKSKVWMMPGAPPTETAGTSENKMILGGRYLEQHYEGTMMGGPFSGVGVTGFDNYERKVVSTWIDSMGTGILTMTGNLDMAGKIITSWGLMNDPAEKRTMKAKSVVTWVDADHHKYEAWHEGPDGKLLKDLEISYTRKK